MLGGKGILRAGRGGIEVNEGGKGNRVKGGQGNRLERGKGNRMKGGKGNRE